MVFRTIRPARQTWVYLGRRGTAGLIVRFGRGPLPHPPSRSAAPDATCLCALSQHLCRLMPIADCLSGGQRPPGSNPPQVIFERTRLADQGPDYPIGDRLRRGSFIRIRQRICKQRSRPCTPQHLRAQLHERAYRRSAYDEASTRILRRLLARTTDSRPVTTAGVGGSHCSRRLFGIHPDRLPLNFVQYM